MKTKKRNKLSLPQLESFLIAKQEYKNKGIQLTRQILDSYQKVAFRDTGMSNATSYDETNFQMIFKSQELDEQNQQNLKASNQNGIISLFRNLIFKRVYKRSRPFEETVFVHKTKVLSNLSEPMIKIYQISQQKDIRKWIWNM